MHTISVSISWFWTCSLDG